MYHETSRNHLVRPFSSEAHGRQEFFHACKANKDIYDISNIAFKFGGDADGTYDDSLIININLIN